MSLQEIHLADEIEWVDGRPMIVGKAFDSSTLIGPIVLVPTGPIELGGCSFDGSAEQVVWTIDAPNVVGLCGVANVKMRNCRLEHVAFTTGEDEAADLRRALTG